MTTKSATALKAAKEKPEPHAGGRKPLGYRVNTWCEITEQSRATFYRNVKLGNLKVIRPNGFIIVPHTEAVRLGYVTE